MQTEFDLVLQKLSEAGSDNIVGQIQKLFIVITKMSDDELVATYQTIDVVSCSLGLASHGLSSLVKSIKDAIVVQMQQQILGCHRIDMGACRVRFSRVTGLPFKSRFELFRERGR